MQVSKDVGQVPRLICVPEDAAATLQPVGYLMSGEGGCGRANTTGQSVSQTNEIYLNIAKEK